MSAPSVNRPASEPPSTWSTAPVMCPAAGEQRKSTAFAMSSARPAFASGIDDTSFARNSSEARSGNASVSPLTSM